MVDIVSNATIATESDAILNRQYDPSSAPSTSTSASSPSAQSQKQQQTVTPAAAPQPDTSSNVQLEITEDKLTNSYIYKFIDKQTGQVIRQWPTEQMVQMRDYFVQQQIQLVDKKV